MSSGSTLAHVMAWCQQAPSHYLNQCWLLIKGVLRHSPIGKANFTESAQDINSKNEMKKHTCKITSTSLRDQWVDEQFLRLNTTHFTIWKLLGEKKKYTNRIIKTHLNSDAILAVNLHQLMISQHTVASCWGVFYNSSDLAVFENETNMSAAVFYHGDGALERSRKM